MTSKNFGVDIKQRAKDLFGTLSASEDTTTKKQETETMIIRRFFSEENFGRIQKHFSFLLKKINASLGELELSIRDEYFNIYYKGNSLSKVTFREFNNYKININLKFFRGTLAEKKYKTYSKNEEGDYCSIILSANQLNSFFQKKYLQEIASKIKREHHKEEIIFEQSLIADNRNKESFFFIDRQVTDAFNQRQFDLLALRQLEKDNNRYGFVVCEVKLGSSRELKNKVAEQLKFYVAHINKNFKDYKKCYEEQYKQKKALGLIDIPAFPSIEIEKSIDGLIIVGGYSGIANEKIKSLKKKHKNLRIKQITYNIDKFDEF